MGAMQSSGAISISQVETQFGGSAATSFSEYYRGGTYVPTAATSASGIPTSGGISLSNFYSAEPHGESVYTTPGTYTWTCPPGVTSVYVVCIGGGASGDGYSESTNYCPYTYGCVTQSSYSQNGGGGGGLAWKTVSVSPGTTYTVQVGSGGVYAGDTGSVGGGLSWFGYDGLVTGYGGNGRYGGIYTGDGGGSGGLGGIQPYTNGRSDTGGTPVTSFSGGGGGAGGYSGPGGKGMCDIYFDTSSKYGPYDDSDFGPSHPAYGVSGGSGGGGGGGGYSTRGGGVGVYGEGDSGGAGSASLKYGGRTGTQYYSWPGGLNWAYAGGDGSGGTYGYGGYGSIGGMYGAAQNGGDGAVRISW